MGRANGASCTAAKDGVVALTQVLAQELAPRVTVNAVAPGPVETERFLPNASDEERERERVRRSAPLPLKRVGWPEDIAWATMPDIEAELAELFGAPSDSWSSDQTRRCKKHGSAARSPRHCTNCEAKRKEVAVTAKLNEGITVAEPTVND